MGVIDPDRLREMVELGVPFSEIAVRLGATRQAVKGKAWRMGLGRGEEGRIAALVAWHQSNRVKAKLFVRPETQIAASVAAVVWPVTITSAGLCDLPPGACHWPVGDAVGMKQLFCGAETVGRHRYCRDHKAEAFEPPRPGCTSEATRVAI